MKTIIISFITGLILSVHGLSAQMLTLEECQRLAKDNYPLIRQYDLLTHAEKYNLNNVTKSYLPQFSLNGQATYQSHVTKIPIDLSSLPVPMEITPLDKDQYKATIDVNQKIWDGGVAHSQQKLIKANTEVEKKQLEVSLYSIQEQVNQLYFGILAINEQLELLKLLEEDMMANKNVMQSMLDNGVAMQSDLDQLDVELLNIEQNRTEQNSLKEAYVKMLSLFIHKEISTNTNLIKPEDSQLISNNINRPELDYYNSQKLSLDAQRSSISAKNMPQLGFFVQGGYGRPGLNMLENKFQLYAMGGIKFTWNFGNLYTRKNEIRIIENNQKSIDVQEETFRFNTNLQLTKEQAEINKIKKLLDKDDEIIRLRHRVKRASESKYKNGVYQINDLIRDINAENQARQTKAIREIQHLQSIYNYKYIQGN